MRASSHRILRSIRETLAHRVSPRVADGDVLALLGAVDLALVELLRRDSVRLGELAQIDARLAAEVARGRTLLGEQKSPDKVTLATLDAAYAHHDALDADAATLVASLRSERRDPAWHAEAEDVINAVVACELDLVAIEHAGLPLERSDLADPAAIDRSKLAEEIRQKLGRASPVSIERVVGLSGGFSRVTLAVDWADAEGRDTLVIRKQKPGGILESVALGVAGEYPLLHYAHKQGLAVPRPFWLESHPAVLNGPFIAMERAEGRPLGSAMGATGVDDDILHQVAVELARLHQLPWERNGKEIASVFDLDPDGLTVRSALNAYLARWKSLWESANLRPSPAMIASYDYLVRNQPRQNVRPCLLHGDIGFHNILFDDGKLTALLDWETAYIGDPAWDVAICKSFVGRYTDWDRFLGWYADAGGYPVDEQAMEYYRVQRVFCQLIVGEMGAQAKFARQPDTEIEYFVLGTPVRQFFLRRLSREPFDNRPAAPQGSKSCLSRPLRLWKGFGPPTIIRCGIKVSISTPMIPSRRQAAS